MKDTMRTSCLLFVCMISLKLLSQDLTDVISIKTLKNFKFINSNKEKNVYSIILSDNSLLSVKYNIVQDGEYNGSYTFIRIPSDFFFENNEGFNYNFILSNINNWGKILCLKPEILEKIKINIKANKAEFSKERFFLDMNFIKDYDESNLTFSNNDDIITCKFFFRRLL